MTIITKGANTPVPAGLLRVAVCRRKVPGTPAAVEVSALLLDAAGKVRGDADLVFHNQPAHPSGAVRHLGTGDGGEQLAEWLELDLPRVEPAVQRVLIAASCDDGVFGAVPGLAAQTVGPDGTIVAHFEVTDAADETAFVLGEFYRRNGEWKFRAVGQGYDSGLAGLATDFGIVVAEQPVAVPVAPVVPAPAPAPAPAVPAPAPVLNTGVAKTSSTTTLVVATEPDHARPFEFTPYVHTGSYEKSITVDVAFPPNSGPVIVEAKVKGATCSVKTPGGDDILHSIEDDFKGRALVLPPREGGPMPLEVDCFGDWTITVLPLSAALPLGSKRVKGHGDEVLAYTGPAAELKIWGERGDAWLRLKRHQGDTRDLDSAERLHDGMGRVKKTVRIPEGPLLFTVERSDGDWGLSISPLPDEAPPGAGGKNVHEGRGEKTVTLVNPRPGRPSLLRYDFPGAERSFDIGVKLVDEYGDEDEWLTTWNHGTRGTALVFSQGQAERTIRVKHSGKWSLRIVPEDEAPMLTGPVEGKGSTVLRYPGPPTLMNVRLTSKGNDEKLTAHAQNHPFGRTVIIADVHGRRRPALGPVFVDPGGSCFVVVSATDGAKWRLEPQPLSLATALGARNQGEGYGVVCHTGPEVEMMVAGTSGILHVYELDENLFPQRKITGSSGPYRIESAFLQVRALGGWVIELRP